MYYQTFTVKDGIDLALYVPGYYRNDIKVTKQGYYIIVEGSTKSKLALEPEFYYKFKLLDRNAEVDPELKNGVLVVHVKNTSEIAATQQLTIR